MSRYLTDGWEDRYRVYITDGDGKRIVLVEGKTSWEVSEKLRAYPVEVRRWLREIVHERVEFQVREPAVKEIGWVTMAAVGLA